MDNFLLTSLLMFLPAFVGNSMPLIVAKTGFLNKYFKMPLDFSKSWNGKRILGDNKTIGGIMSAILGGIFVGFIFILASYKGKDWLWELEYSTIVAFGALIGDSVKSFFKRRMNRKSGASWVPFDQIDYVIGGWIFSGFFIPYEESLLSFLFILFVSPIFHFLANVLAYKIGLKKVWW